MYNYVTIFTQKNVLYKIPRSPLLSDYPMSFMNSL